MKYWFGIPLCVSFAHIIISIVLMNEDSANLAEYMSGLGGMFGSILAISGAYLILILDKEYTEQKDIKQKAFITQHDIALYFENTQVLTNYFIQIFNSFSSQLSKYPKLGIHASDFINIDYTYLQNLALSTFFDIDMNWRANISSLVSVLSYDEVKQIHKFYTLIEDIKRFLQPYNHSLTNHDIVKIAYKVKQIEDFKLLYYNSLAEKLYRLSISG